MNFSVTSNISEIAQYQSLIVTIRLSCTLFEIIKFLLVGNHVFSARGAAGDIYLRTLKKQPRLYVHISLSFCVYLALFRSFLNYDLYVVY